HRCAGQDDVGAMRLDDVHGYLLREGNHVDLVVAQECSKDPAEWSTNIHLYVAGDAGDIDVRGVERGERTASTFACVEGTKEAFDLSRCDCRSCPDRTACDAHVLRRWKVVDAHSPADLLRRRLVCNGHLDVAGCVHLGVLLGVRAVGETEGRE